MAADAMRPIRLTAVLTHPVQDHSPWFRHVAAYAPEIDLTVLYGTEPTAEQQGTGFGRSFRWDVPLLEGYRSRVIRAARPGDRTDSSSFFGLDVPEIGNAIRETNPDVVLVPGGTRSRCCERFSRRDGSRPAVVPWRYEFGLRARGLAGSSLALEDEAPPRVVRRVPDAWSSRPGISGNDERQSRADS